MSTVPSQSLLFKRQSVRVRDVKLNCTHLHVRDEICAIKRSTRAVASLKKTRSCASRTPMKNLILATPPMGELSVRECNEGEIKRWNHLLNVLIEIDGRGDDQEEDDSGPDGLSKRSIGPLQVTPTV